MKYKVTKVFATDTKKDGTKMVSKFGKPQWRVGLKLQEFGDVWVNGFMPFNPDKWENTEQELIIEDGVFNGQPQKSFTLPKKEDVNNEALLRIEKKVDSINWHIVEFLKAQKNGTPMYTSPEMEGIDVSKSGEVPEDINPEDIPFN